LDDLPPGRFLDAVAETLPEDHYLIATTTRVYARPDPTSFDWASIRRGILVLCNRIGPSFSHITYVERDEHADPPYVTYQITGVRRCLRIGLLERRLTIHEWRHECTNTSSQRHSCIRDPSSWMA
jgi:hypothetical protein